MVLYIDLIGSEVSMRYQINRSKYLSPSELQHLTNIIAKDDSRNGILLKLALATGARAQELLNIAKSDLNDEQQSVFIKGLKNSNDREIPLEKGLYASIRSLADSNPDKVFDISYPRLQMIWDYYRPVKKKFHSLRHTFAIELYRRTKDLLLVQAALGHRNIQNSLVYTEHLYQTEFLKGILAKAG